MNEAKGSLRSIEQKYKLFQQQQFTFITALEHCRENAHDKIRPISSIEQVQSYMEHHCSNATDRRVLHMFLDLCAELSRLCQRFESLHSGTPVTNSLLDKCKTLVSQSNDLSSLRAKTKGSYRDGSQTRKLASSTPCTSNQPAHVLMSSRLWTHPAGAARAASEQHSRVVQNGQFLFVHS
ncbi:sperm acrosome-associated protein 9 isoform X4 [Desmodus rotundus]|uniref:sperm acrosome-associated protein 9 isoform X4 n=1 Tax=Desmodus rotundus TaxID=9430 RepID=UPI0023817EEB|nr:sperm acrosome-associated protein 9 isoform X4 [Desmodus rotundus]